MVKLQQIQRSNGSIVSFVNIPLEVVVSVGLKKGELLSIIEKIDRDGMYIEVRRV